ncbi:MAG: flagellar export protein FliJ [Aquincola sp.]|uniref:flagellar export protein FliJ n=1 Tax=uncultured Aquincola sp. TaxID=886556 RepID=UPI0032B239B1|nr:flagellar export protein FliJ [Aquincola sp.]|tara:strand:+ start:4681 stop:5133 length:453 start_codon:yes stop_codon:yes gene_type:complete
MADNTQALATLLERETTERDNLLTALQQAQARAQAAQQQAEQLVAYRDDYHRRWSSQFRTAGTMDIVRCYQDFAQRLEEAIAQQARVATHAETQVQRAREALTAQEIRVASVRKLIERRQAEALRAAERRDQKQTDEAASRAAWRPATTA